LLDTFDLKIVLSSGEEVLVPIGHKVGHKVHDKRPALIEERLRAAMDGYREGGAAGDAAVLRQGGRSTSAWISALRAIGVGANADMRTAPLPRERLFRIVEDASAAPADRAAAAAAVALGTELDDDERARLAHAAEVTAAPGLRVALAAAAGGAVQAEIEAALEEMASEEERVAGRRM
jgi:hypothetical protein